MVSTCTLSEELTSQICSVVLISACCLGLQLSRDYTKTSHSLKKSDVLIRLHVRTTITHV